MRFQPGDTIYDVTPVENLFIETFLAQAPGDFVKVYLYGLMLCYRDEAPGGELPGVAAALDLSTDQVRAALSFWEEKGVLRVLCVQPLDVEYINLKHLFINGSRAEKPRGNAEYDQLCTQLNQLFRGQRTLSYGDLAMVREWLEVLDMESAAILLVVNYCVREKSAQISFRYIDKIIQARSQAGETDFESVNRYIRQREIMQSGAASLLKRWNIQRPPSDDELSLYQKWQGDWGFEDGAIGRAAAEMVGSSYPNFKYLDRLLDTLRREQVRTTQEVEQYYRARGQEEEACLALVRALGLRSTPPSAPSVLELYRRRTAQNFTPEALNAAAAYLERRGQRSLEHLDALLDSYLERGLITLGAIDAYNLSQQSAAEGVKGWFERWGMTRAPQENELRAYQKFVGEWRIPQEVIDLAIEDSMGAQYPMTYFARIMKSCHDRGVGTAQAYKSQQTTGAAKRLANKAERDYSNRHDYAQEDLNAIYTDIFAEDDT